MGRKPIEKIFGGMTMPTIDADAHVLETPETWRYIGEAEKHFTPMVVNRTAGAIQHGLAGNEVGEYWVIDGRLVPKQDNAGLDTTAAAREMRDIPARLAHMDELGIDVQVLYPTVFLRPMTLNVDLGFALCRSYNRWLADIWSQSPDRLRWVAMPPLMSMDKVADEMAFAKDHGAVGIFVCGLECDRQLSDPYFFPLYEIASKLDMPICIHSATNSFTMHDFFLHDAGFNKFKLATIGAFHVLIFHAIPTRFPDVRWAFIEVSSQWVPYLINDLSIRFKRQGKPLGDDVLARNNIYVACQVTDDLPYVLGYAGEDNLVVGTDYGHADTATEIDALRMLKADGRVPAHVVDKILDDNARALYAL